MAPSRNGRSRPDRSLPVQRPRRLSVLADPRKTEAVALAERLATMCPDLKVLFISGYNDQLTSRNSWLEQGKTLLQKPFLPAALARKVREVLDSSNDTIELGG